MQSKLSENLNELIYKFWEIESDKNTRPADTENEYCKAFFKNNYSRQENGRFVFKLPVKEEVVKSLGNSKEIAQKYALERKFICIREKVYT